MKVTRRDFVKIIGITTIVSKLELISLLAELKDDKIIQDHLEHTVYIDKFNGIEGTQFPIGTRALPVNNLVDAFEIIRNMEFDKSCTLKFMHNQSKHR